MKNILYVIMIFQVFYIARAESSIGLNINSSINKASVTSTDYYDYLEEYYNIHSLAAFFNYKNNKFTFGWGNGLQPYKHNFFSNYYNEEIQVSGDVEHFKLYLSYERTDLIYMFFKSSRINDFINISPMVEFYLAERCAVCDAEYPFYYKFGINTYYLRLGNTEPFIGFHIPLNKSSQAWDLTFGLNLNIPLSGKNKAFEDF